ncbi:MAG TPA: DUF4331 domain-containing protein [Acidobacteriaceae bacterium]
MSKRVTSLALAMSMVCMTPYASFASSHREAPITALDHAADITDFYAFVSYDHPDRVTFIMNVDPFLEPSNGPNYFPFDPSILYEIKVDNTFDAVADVTFQVRFNTEYRAPNLFTSAAGAGAGLPAAANSPAPVKPGTPIVPPAITSLDGPGAAGLGVRQNYTVTMVKGGKSYQLTGSKPLYAVPSNIGPRTMPDYEALAQQGIYTVSGAGQDFRVFAGTVADPFFIDLGAAFDSFNFRANPGSGVPGVLSASQDADDHTNIAMNSLSGFNVNTIVIEVPIAMLTSDGKTHAATDPQATIGSWATTSRPQISIRRAPQAPLQGGNYVQVQRLANPLINELVTGTGSKDYWSMSEPKNDAQFANFAVDPLLPRIFNAIYGINIPAPPRTDLELLYLYKAPIAAAGTPTGPPADLLRLNTGVAPTALAQRKRLGVIAGDGAGFPNGRRLTDDVVDIAARVVGGGILAGGKFAAFPNNSIGDGVNAPDVPPQETFPYVHYAYSGRDSRHIDVGETGCGTQPTGTSSLAPPTDQGGDAPCPVQ